MPGPFPGVDPYLEDPAFWPEFHHLFITYLFEALNEILPQNYQARVNERSNLVDVSAWAAKQIIPDVAVDKSPAPTPPSGVVTATLETEPVTLPITILDQETEGYIEILHQPGRELITVIELLSPTNKAGEGRRDYIVKRNAILKRLVHLVELDFLVGGHRMPMAAPLPAGDYYAVVSRYEPRPDSQVYAWSVRQPLPKILVPLKAPDPDVALDLAAVFATTYQRGRYQRVLDYTQQVPAPLAPDDRTWVEAQARQSASRS
jgi:hypothetical protein